MGPLTSPTVRYSIPGNHGEALRRQFLQTATVYLRAVAFSDLAIFAADEEEQVVGFFDPSFDRNALHSDRVAGTDGGHLVPS